MSRWSTACCLIVASTVYHSVQLQHSPLQPSLLLRLTSKSFLIFRQLRISLGCITMLITARSSLPLALGRLTSDLSPFTSHLLIFQYGELNYRMPRMKGPAGSFRYTMTLHQSLIYYGYFSSLFLISPNCNGRSSSGDVRIDLARPECHLHLAYLLRLCWPQELDTSSINLYLLRASLVYTWIPVAPWSIWLSSICCYCGETTNATGFANDAAIIQLEARAYLFSCWFLWWKAKLLEAGKGKLRNSCLLSFFLCYRIIPFSSTICSNT